jgi:hypothetical protein
MINENDILKKILLNMRYDSSMTLNENYDLIVEQTKTPSVSVDNVESLGIIPNEPIRNGSILSVLDYNGNPMTFFGYVGQTIQQKQDELLNEIKQSKEASYRSEPKYVDTVEYIGPDHNKKLFYAYRQNKITLSELKYKVGEQSLRYTKKIIGYKYKPNTIGYIATLCRADLQSKIKKNWKDKETINRLNTKDFFAEPANVLNCVENSINSMFKGMSKNGLFSFWSTKPNTNEKEYYYLSYHCGIQTTDSVATHNLKQTNPEAIKKGQEIKTTITKPCSSSTMLVSGYVSINGVKWDKVKNENKKIVDKLKTTNPNIGTGKKEKGDITGSEIGVSTGTEGAEGSITLDLEL